MAYQLSLFDCKEESELECIKNAIKEARESSEKVRRGIFARHSDLTRKYLELNDRLQIIERSLCQHESPQMLFRF